MKEELMKIQTIFGIYWIELSNKELEKKKKIKKKKEEWEKEYKGRDINSSHWLNHIKDESYFTHRLEICQKLSEALNPVSWESLGAAEIGKRIREFQEMTLTEES